jgi:hypothetical protein
MSEDEAFWLAILIMFGGITLAWVVMVVIHDR